MPSPQQGPEKDSGRVTLFRTVNFFVHAATPMRRTEELQQAGAEATLLERIRWVSAEKQRLMAAQTRLLPQIDTVNSTLCQEIAIPAWLEAMGVAFVLCITLIVQALNMFNYPAYTVNEGNYMANAWALLHGNIEPYAYTYDHPPIGWLQIAAWTQLTGGTASFGNAINSGRVLMLVLAATSSVLLYLTASRLSGSRSAALVAIIIYTLSPLSLIYRREVLLDNIGTFWLLLSLCLITTGKSRLRTFALAGVALGIAILTKEIFLLFIPTMLYAVWLYATPFQRKFSLVAFIYIALSIASAYVLLALLKGELFPADLLPGDRGPHPSLIEALVQKTQMPLVGGQLSESWSTWMQNDMLLFVAGTIAMFINILGGTVNRFQLLAALFAVTFWIFLLSSPIVYPISVVLLLPFLALNIALALNTPLRWVTRKVGFDLARALLLFALIGVLIPAGIQNAEPLLLRNTAGPQQEAMLWIRTNVPHEAVIITNSYLYSDLREPGGMGVGNGTPFSQAQIYSKAVLDPEVFYKELKGDWQKIDFLVVDPTMLKEIRAERQYALWNQALHHAILRVEFGSSIDGTQIQVYQVIPT
jgi:4-amino-4-deoxy-L-arabinose transferase-like glycosyltransferase